jgi:hypothetical protein
MRFFRANDAAVYESIRLQLDAAWGLPDAGQQTCYTPAAAALRDSLGRLLLAVDDAFCDYDPVPAMLPALIQSGAVTEIDAATYRSSLPTLPY